MTSLRNEEDTKIKLVERYLRELGFSDDELSFEVGFTIQLGRLKHQVGASSGSRKKSKKEPAVASGRADIIVKRGSQPALVIEVKDTSATLSDADRDQVVSYARLHHPIVPVAAVSNGTEWRFFDPVSRSPIGLDTLVAATGRTIPADTALQHEALVNFLGYSQENVRWFCDAVVHDTAGLYEASPPDELPLYVPSLYVEPTGLAGEWAAFLAAVERRVFLVTGQSGAGKSAWIVHRALATADAGVACLFYRAKDIADGFVSRLAADLAWALSPNLTPEAAARRFSDLLKGNQLLVFVDSADEGSLELARDALDEVLQRFPPSVRLVVACKTSRVEDLARDVDDLPARWFTALANANGVDASVLEPRDFWRLLAAHRDHFGVNLRLSDEVLRDARAHPSIIRIAYEVAKDQGTDFAGYNSREFFAKYVDGRVRRFGDKRVTARSFLSGLADRMFQDNIEDLDETDAVTLGDESLYHRAVDLHFLATFKNATGRARVRFVESRVRDYFVVMEARRWLSRPAAEIATDPEFMSATSGPRLEAAELFYLLATDAHRAVVDSVVRANCERTIAVFAAAANAVGPKLAGRLSPPASERCLIGYIHVARRELLTLGFAPPLPGHGRVVLWPRSHGTMTSGVPFTLGVRTLYGIGSGFTDQRKAEEFAFWHCFKKELLDLIEVGGLDETPCHDLLMERAAALAVSLECARRHQHYVMIESTPLSVVRENLIARRASSDFLSSHPPASTMEGVDGMRLSVYGPRESAAAKAHGRAVARGAPTVLPPTQTGGSTTEMEQDLWDCLALLDKEGVRQLDSLFPEPNASGPMVWSQWTPERMGALLVGFYGAFNSAIRALAAANFSPDIAAAVTKGSEPNTSVIVSIDPEGDGFEMCTVRNPTGRLPPGMVSDSADMPGVFERGLCTVHGEKYQIVERKSMSFGHALNPTRRHLPKSWTVSSSLCPLRGMVYHELESRLEEMLSTIAQQLGVPAQPT
jgi:hypothetical protein